VLAFLRLVTNPRVFERAGLIQLRREKCWLPAIAISLTRDPGGSSGAAKPKLLRASLPRFGHTEIDSGPRNHRNLTLQ
jgi:hypothetical protein